MQSLSIYRFLRALLLTLLISGAFGIHAQSNKSDGYFEEGIAAYNRQDYKKAIDCFSKAEALDKKEISPDSQRYGYSKWWMAYCYHKMGDDTKAKELAPYHWPMEPVDRRLTVECDREADLANDATKKGDMQQALSHALKCIEIEEQVLGKKSLHYVGSCLVLSEIYGQMRDFSSALKRCDEALELLASMGLENDICTFRAHHSRVWVCLKWNMLAMTYGDIEKMKGISKHLESENGDMYPTALTRIIETRMELQSGTDSNKAADLAEEAFRLLVDSYKPENEDAFFSISDCMVDLSMLGKNDLIDELLHYALQTLENKGLTDRDKGMLFTWLGDFATDMETSLNYYEQAAGLLKNLPDKDAYYENQLMIAISYAGSNRVNEAIAIFEEICRYYENGNIVSGPYKRALRELGDLYYALGRPDKASVEYKKVLALLENDKTNPEYILTLFKWVPICGASTGADADGKPASQIGYELGEEIKTLLSGINISDFISAGIGVHQIASAVMPFYRALFSGAAIINGMPWQKMESDLRMFIYDKLMPVFPIEEYVTRDALAVLAHLNFILGNYDEAIRLTKQVVEVAKAQGREYDNYLHDLAYYQYDSGDSQSAYENFEIGYKFLKDEVLRNYRWMTLEERTAYTNMRRGNLDNLPHYAAITHGDTRYAALGYNALLFTKGLLLNSTIELTRILQEEGDRESLKLLNEWRNLNEQLQTMGAADDSKRFELQQKATAIEKQLMGKSQAFGDYTKGLAVEYGDVQRALGGKDIAIEFFSYQKDAKTRHYGALVLTRHDAPRYVDVGDDISWQSLDLSGGGCYKNVMLFNLIFRNLLDIMPTWDEGNVYFSADGLLHTVALENLPGSEKYSLRRLSSTRELALTKSDVDSKISGMALYGGISYGLGDIADYYREQESATERSGGFLKYLPGTKIEAEEIYNLVSPECKVSKITGEKATKESFKRLSGTHTDIIHVATHGFFNLLPGGRGSKDDIMSATGLFFAGAQNTLWDMDTEKLKDDGILTAHEISVLDFRGLKLAVLSACETGLGAVEQDGVFGLQRGFKQAGTQSILMSLWNVNDAATQLLMTEFYKNLIAGCNQYDALKKAQGVVRLKFEDPKYWAAFILIDANNKINL